MTSAARPSAHPFARRLTGILRAISMRSPRRRQGWGPLNDDGVAMTTPPRTTASRMPAPPSQRSQGTGATVVPAAAPWRMAAADLSVVSSGMIAFGLVLGITIHAFGRDAAAGIIGAATVYGGSAQLTTVTLLSQQSALALAVLGGVVVN